MDGETAPSMESKSPFRVPERLFAASIWGNEKLPQKYFTIISQILAEALSSPEWEKMLDGYFDSALNDAQAERLAKAATKSHERYRIVRPNGDPIVVDPPRAEGLWNAERSRALSFLCQVALSAGGRVPDMQVTPSSFIEDYDNYVRAYKETMRALKEDVELRAHLAKVFTALQSVIESAEMESQFTIYKSLLTNRKAIAEAEPDPATGERPTTHWQYGEHLRSEIIRRARRIATAPEEQKILDLVETYAAGLML